MPNKASSGTRDRHCYVRFFPSDWVAGVAGLSDLAELLYFRICLQIWDKGRPVPGTTVRTLASRLGAGEALIDELVTNGKIQEDSDGTFSNIRAMAEARHAWQQWEVRSKGGKNNRLRKSHSKTHTMSDGSTDVGSGSVSDEMPHASLKSCNNQNQNQNQNQIDSTINVESRRACAGARNDKSNGGKGRETGTDPGAPPAFALDGEEPIMARVREGLWRKLGPVSYGRIFQSRHGSVRLVEEEGRLNILTSHGLIERDLNDEQMIFRGVAQSCGFSDAWIR